MDVKAKLTGAQWRKHVERTINVDDEAVSVIIRRPPETVLLGLLDEMKKSGDVDEKHQPVSDMAGMRFLARLTALCLFADGGVRPMFTQAEASDLLSYPWLLDLQEDVMSAMGRAGTLVEAAKGNSEATPT